MQHFSCDDFTLSVDEIKALVKGKFNTRKCPDCEGKGWFWVYEDGTQRSPTKGEDEDDFYQHPCGDEECNGLGFFIVFDGEDE